MCLGFFLKLKLKILYSFSIKEKLIFAVTYIISFILANFHFLITKLHSSKLINFTKSGFTDFPSIF